MIVSRETEAILQRHVIKFTQLIQMQWYFYSGDTLGTKGSVPWIEDGLEFFNN